VEDSATLFQALNSDIWAESVQFAVDLAAHARDTMRDRVGGKVGGEGDYRILCFLVRFSRPSRVIETGVAAGYSSAAILRAMAVNDHGHLWSSDFPYFRGASRMRGV
jgi:predicted O-methyltransferase YrrM